MLTCCASLVALRYQDRMRARMNGWLMAWACFTGIVFVLVAGYVASAVSWRAPFALHGAVALTFLMPCLCVERDARTAGGIARVPDFRGLRPASPAFLTAAVMFAVLTTYFFQLSFVMVSAGIADAQSISRIYALCGLAATLMALAYAWRGSRFDPRRIALIGLTLFTFGMALTAFAHDFWTFAGAICIYSAGSALTQASLFTRVMLLVDKEQAPRALGLVTTSFYFGGAAGPALFAPLLWFVDLRSEFLILAAGMLVWIAGATYRLPATRPAAVFPRDERTRTRRG